MGKYDELVKRLIDEPWLTNIGVALDEAAAAIESLEAELQEMRLQAISDFGQLQDARSEAFEEAARVCEEKVERPADYQGRWGGYGRFMGDKTGPECAAAIRALAEREVE